MSDTINIAICEDEKIQVDLLEEYVKKWASSGGMKYRFKYIIEQVKKVVDTDYENIDGPQGQNKLMKALMATHSNSSGTEAITKTLVEYLSNSMGLILYGSIIFTIHPLLITFIILASIINYFVGNYANKFEHEIGIIWLQ